MQYLILPLRIFLSKLLKYFVVVYFLTFSHIISANDDGVFSIEKCSRFNVGLIYSKYNFNGIKYSPGFIIQHNYCIKPTRNFGVGVGAGFMKYKEQTFLPLYFDFLSCRKSNFYGNIQTGYSFAWKADSKYYPDYSFNGGLYSQLGIGYKFKLINEYNSCLFIGYNHQIASLKSSVLSDKNLHFNSLVVTIGIMLEKK